MVSAVLQTSFLGDMILTTPLIERLAQDGPVHVVATPANAGILRHHPAVASVIVFDKRRADRGLGGLLRVARALRATGATRAFLAQGSLRTAALAQLAGIRDRIGFETSPGRLLYTRRVPFDATAHHAIRLWQLAANTGERAPAALRPSLFPGTEEYAAVSALLAEHDVQPTETLIALAPGSVWATKRWPSYDALARLLLDHVAYKSSRSVRLIILGGPNDRPLAEAIEQAASAGGESRVIDATGKLSLLASAAMLSRVQTLVTNDSAPLHLASAMNTPTVALFGPTVLRFGFGPLADRHRVLEVAGLSCRPCGAHGPKSCPLGHWRCMKDQSAEDVAEATRAMVVGT